MQKNKQFNLVNGIGVFLFALLFLIFPKLSQAATLNISPGSGNYGVGSTITVTVVTNTQGAAVNTAEANVSFSNLDFISAKQGSTFYLPSPGSAKNSGSSIYFGGGLPSPGYTGGGGVLGIITFRTKAEGVASVNITSGKVLLNDGLGTDALSGISGARFSVTPPPVGVVSVSSTTHPDSNLWYPKSDLELTWNRPQDAYGYSFEFDQNPTTVPDSTLDTTVTTNKSYSGLKDGTWYFHIRARPQSPSSGFGVTTHYKIQIDTAPPSPFEIKVAESTITFAAEDAGSGIDHYQISSEGKVYDEKGTSPFTFFGLKNGDHQIKVTAFDKAGNKQESTTNMSVKGVTIGFFQRSLQVPLYLILLVNLIILILIGLVMWLLMHKKRSRTAASNEISDLQAELDQLKKEYVDAEDLNKKITKTKRKIESKLSKIKKAR